MRRDAEEKGETGIILGGIVSSDLKMKKDLTQTIPVMSLSRNCAVSLHLHPRTAICTAAWRKLDDFLRRAPSFLSKIVSSRAAISFSTR